jgi:mono/diheme cytochrome c family protein
MRMMLMATAGLCLLATGAGAAEERDLIARGRYLVDKIAMCGDCHTPRGDKGEPDWERHLTGSPVFFTPKMQVPDWAEKAPAIAGPAALGWTRPQLVKFLESGRAPDGSQARPPMPTFRLGHADAEAVAAYLHSLPAENTAR